MCFRRFIFLLRFFLFDLLQLVSFNELYSFYDESDYDGSDSGSSGTCPFPFRFDDFVGCVGDFVGRVGESVGRVSDMGSVVFVLTGINSIGDFVLLVLFVPKGVDSKGG